MKLAASEFSFDRLINWVTDLETLLLHGNVVLALRRNLQFN